MAGVSLLVGLAGLAASSLALRIDSSDQSKAVPMEMARIHDDGGACVPPGAYRQQLTNAMDLQYFTELTLGGQRITGILDTGSFELVVFSRSCSTCGQAAVYDETRSPTFVEGNMTKVHAYGSGSCTSKRGADEVQLGCYRTPRQAIWFAQQCRMPLLRSAGFQSIVGVGPPGQPERTARDTIKQLDEMEARLRTMHKEVPQDLLRVRAQAEEELRDALSQKSLLESFSMRTFSTCLGRKVGSPGWMVWNDITREGAAGTTRLPVVGTITWGVALESMALEFVPSSDTDVSSVSEMPVGCEKGCGAIVDTGTSLLAVPTAIYRTIAETLDRHLTLSDCNDLSNFPALIITVAGHKLRLPPSSYIGTAFGEPSAQATKYLHMTSRAQGAACELLLMDLGKEVTQFGPMVILGMPLFREYYTTFDLGSERGQRAIFVTPASESCDPDRSPSVSYLRDRAAITPRHVDLAHVRAPEWLDNRTGIAV